MALRKVQMWTDGSVRPTNPGRGGWAVLLIDVQTGIRKTLSGKAERSTNNLMELYAVLQGFSALKFSCEVEVCTDSALVIGWMTGKMERRNQDCLNFIRRIEHLQKGHRVLYTKVAGHSGIAENELVDSLASQMAEPGE